MAEETLLVNDIDVRMRRVGEGKPLLILHGWGSSINSWKHVQDIIAAVGYDVVCPDLPGFGESESPEKPWHVNDYVQTVLQLADRVGFKKFTVLSHSFGGQIAVKLAADNPECVEKLILCAPSAIRTGPSRGAQRAAMLSRMSKRAAGKGLTSFTRKIFYAFLPQKDYARANEVMKLTMQNVLKENMQPYLKKIHQPTLLVWGTADKLVSVEHARLFKQAIPHAEVELFEKVGHSPHLEVPDQFLVPITRFLRK